MSTAASAPSSITHLEILWQSLDELCSDLTADEWRLPGPRAGILDPLAFLP